MEAATVTLVTRDFPPLQPGQPPDTVMRELARCGWTATREADDPGLERSEVVLLRGNPIWFGRQLRRLAELRADGRRSPRVVVWLTEPLPLPREAPFPRPRLFLREVADIARRHEGRTDPYSNARELRRLGRLGLVDLILVSTPSGVGYLAEQGTAARHVPIWSPPSDGGLLGLERDLDVVFVGELVPRRRRLIRRLERDGVRVEARGGWLKGGLWGDERTRLLNRARIMLNLARHPGMLSGRRLQLGMVNGTLIVSEPIFDTRPYDEGKHFVAAPVDELPGLVHHYLEHEEERARIAEAGRRLVVARLTERPVVEALVPALASVLDGRAAITAA